MPPETPRREKSPATPAQQILLGLAIFWGIVLVVIGVRLLHRPTNHSVFPLFYDTGRIWRAGGDVYAKLGTFRYSPLLAAAYAALSYLPLRLSQFVWMAANLLVLGTGLIVWARDGLPVAWTAQRRALLLVLATPFMIGNISNLQANPMMLGAMLLAIVWTRQHKFARAVAALMLATALKLYPFGLGILLCLKFPKQFSWRLALGLAALLLLPFLTQHPGYVWGSYHDWWHVLRHDQRVDMGITEMYRDAAIIWFELFGKVNPAIDVAVQASTMILVGLCTLRLRRSRLTTPSQLHIINFLFLLWILLFGPATESATYMLAAPVAAWLVLDSLDRPDRLLRRTAILGYALLFIGSFMAWVPHSKTMKNIPLQPISCFILLAALALAIRHLPRNATEKSE